MIWCCPKCNNPLSVIHKSLVCGEGHNYDRAKQGYVNLLLANQKNSLDPGDSDLMIEARKQFLRAGYYNPLLEALFDELKQYGVVHQRQRLSVLDLGCGEGYYLESLVSKYLESELGYIDAYGIDISKAAVRRAATANRQRAPDIKSNVQQSLDYAVASNSNIPVCDQSADFILTVFAPVVPSQLQRVLKPEGVFVRVVPGPRHLFELRSEIYSEVRLHEQQALEEGFHLIKTISVQYTLCLDKSESIEQLLAMTPFNWRGETEVKQVLIDRGLLEVEIDFLIQVCEVTPSVG